MKRFISLILMFFYIFATNACMAGELYTIKNAKLYNVTSQVSNVILKNNYLIKTTNPIFAVSEYNTKNYVSIVLTPDNNNVLCYIDTNEFTKNMSNAIIKNFSKQGLNYEKTSNTNIEQQSQKLVDEVLSAGFTEYSFDTPSNQSNQVTLNSNSDSFSGYVSKAGNGTLLQVYLQNAINTQTASKGDEVIAVLKEDWRKNNSVIAPQGSVVYGTISDAEPARSFMRDAKVEIDFNKIITPENKVYQIKTESVNFDVSSGENKFKKVAGNALGVAAAGAIVGLLGTLIFGGDNRNYGKSALIGAGVGAGLTMATNAVQKGEDAEIPSFTDLEIKIVEDINVMINNK